MKNHHIPLYMLCLSLLALGGLNESAIAQDQPEAAAIEEAAPESQEKSLSFEFEPPAQAETPEPKRLEISDAPNLVPNYGYTIAFVHKDVLPHEAVLRVTFPLNVSGCYRVTPPESTVKTMGRTVEILLSDPVIKLDDSPKYGHNTCPSMTGSVLADVVLNRDDLIEKQINKLSIRNSIGQEQYDVIVNKNKIVLYTKVRDNLTNTDRRVDEDPGRQLFKPYEGSRTETPLTYWFYPENTVVLKAPMAGAGEDVSEEIRKFARGRGMVEIDAFISDFETPTKDKNRLYFVDQVGTLAQTLDRDSTTVVGSITVGETFHGPNGPYERARELEVTANAPGLME